MRLCKQGKSALLLKYVMFYSRNKANSYYITDKLIYTLFQNGRHFSILLFTCKLALANRLKENILLNFEFKNEAKRAYLQVNKIIPTWQPFWNKVYRSTKKSAECDRSPSQSLLSYHH